MRKSSAGSALGFCPSSWAAGWGAGEACGLCRQVQTKVPQGSCARAVCPRKSFLTRLLQPNAARWCPVRLGWGGGSHGGVPPAAALCPSDPQPPEVKWGASPTALSWQTGTVAPGSLPATPPVSAEPSCKLSFRPAPGSRGGVLVPGWGRRSGPVAAEPPASPLPSPCPRQQGDRTRGCHCASHLLVSAGPAGEPPPRLVPRHI